jgi:hypothetical protein
MGRQVRGALVMRAVRSGTSVADARVCTDEEWGLRSERAKLPVRVPHSSGRRVWGWRRGRGLGVRDWVVVGIARGRGVTGARETERVKDERGVAGQGLAFRVISGRDPAGAMAQSALTRVRGKAG